MKVKVGAHLMIWTGKVKHYVDYFKKAKEIGLDGVEIPFPNVQDFTPDMVKRIRRELDKLGLQATCGAGLGREISLISPDRGIREKGKTYLKRCIDICSDLDSHVLAGVLYGAFGVSVGRSRTEEEWAWAVESLQEGAEYAAQREVVLCLEAINRYETYFVNTAEDTAHLVTDVGKDNVKLHLDTYQMNIEEKDFYTLPDSVN